jgi:AraC-like DNA-binding protein
VPAVYSVQGSAHYVVNGVPHDLEAGDLLYLKNGDAKEAVTHPQHLMHCYEVNFSSKYPLPKKAREDGLFPTVSHIGIRQDIIDLFREMNVCWAGRQSGYVIKTRALLMLILHRLSEIILFDSDSSAGDYRVTKVTRYIADHYAEKLTVKSLAKIAHLNADYFGHLFKRETGVMVNQYITQTRIRNAENMLQSGNFKVHEAAEQCGFSDSYHFYKSFRAIRGFAPSRCIPKGE